MSEAPSVLFPLILDTLSHKPLLSESQKVLLKDLKEKLTNEGIKIKNFKKELDAAIDIGKGLGILSVLNEEVRMPFLLKNNGAVDDSHAVDRLHEGVKPRSKSVPGTRQNRDRNYSGHRTKSRKYDINTPDKIIGDEYCNRKRFRSRSRSHAVSRKHKRRTRSRRR